MLKNLSRVILLSLVIVNLFSVPALAGKLYSFGNNRYYLQDDANYGQLMLGRMFTKSNQLEIFKFRITKFQVFYLNSTVQNYTEDKNWSHDVKVSDWAYDRTADKTMLNGYISIQSIISDNSVKFAINNTNPILPANIKNYNNSTKFKYVYSYQIQKDRYESQEGISGVRYTSKNKFYVEGAKFSAYRSGSSFSTDNSIAPELVWSVFDLEAEKNFNNSTKISNDTETNVKGVTTLNGGKSYLYFPSKEGNWLSNMNYQLLNSYQINENGKILDSCFDFFKGNVSQNYPNLEKNGDWEEFKNYKWGKEGDSEKQILQSSSIYIATGRSDQKNFSIPSQFTHDDDKFIFPRNENQLPFFDGDRLLTYDLNNFKFCNSNSTSGECKGFGNTKYLQMNLNVDFSELNIIDLEKVDEELGQVYVYASLISEDSKAKIEEIQIDTLPGRIKPKDNVISAVNAKDNFTFRIKLTPFNKNAKFQLLFKFINPNILQDRVVNVFDSISGKITFNTNMGVMNYTHSKTDDYTETRKIKVISVKYDDRDVYSIFGYSTLENINSNSTSEVKSLNLLKDGDKVLRMTHNIFMAEHDNTTLVYKRNSYNLNKGEIFFSGNLNNFPVKKKNATCGFTVRMESTRSYANNTYTDGMFASIRKAEPIDKKKNPTPTPTPTPAPTPTPSPGRILTQIGIRIFNLI